MKPKDSASGQVLSKKQPNSFGGGVQALQKRQNLTDEKLELLIDELTVIKNESQEALTSLKDEQKEQKQIVLYALFIIAVTVATMLLTALGIVIDYLSDDPSVVNVNLEK